MPDMPKAWIKAVAETFGRKRLTIAPIDEPCDKWLSDLANVLRSHAYASSQSSSC